MGFLFIIIRTFPFWAVPLGATLLFYAPRIKKKSGSGKRAMFAVFLGLLMWGGSGAYLVFNGHQRAVPFFHELYSSWSLPGFDLGKDAE